MTSQFDLTRFYDVIICNSVFQLGFFYSGIPDPVLKLEQFFQKKIVVTGKTPLFVIGPFCGRYSIYLNICF